MEVKVDTKTILARPLDSLEEVLPCNTLEERFTRIDLDSPVRDGDTNPVQARRGDLSKVFLGLDITISGQILKKVNSNHVR
jgi:hypothetical protein